MGASPRDTSALASNEQRLKGLNQYGALLPCGCVANPELAGTSEAKDHQVTASENAKGMPVAASDVPDPPSLEACQQGGYLDAAAVTLAKLPVLAIAPAQHPSGGCSSQVVV